MLTTVGTVGVSRATPVNRDALQKFCHSVYRHSKENEDTLG